MAFKKIEKSLFEKKRNRIDTGAPYLSKNLKMIPARGPQTKFSVDYWEPGYANLGKSRVLAARLSKSRQVWASGASLGKSRQVG